MKIKITNKLDKKIYLIICFSFVGLFFIYQLGIFIGKLLF